MAQRPCNPGEDLKGLWRALLPGTPFPACGVPQESDETVGADGSPAATDDTAGPNEKRGAVAR